MISTESPATPLSAACDAHAVAFYVNELTPDDGCLNVQFPTVVSGFVRRRPTVLRVVVIVGSVTYNLIY